MSTLSLCMIVKNEENNLEQCLTSIADAVDEIIIVDTGSSDKTIEIAKRWTPYVYSFEWINDFSAARNYAFSKATCDYVMWLDADDILFPSARIALHELMQTLDTEIDCVMMKYDIAFDVYGKTTFSYHRERIIKNYCGFMWKEPVHEYIDVRNGMRITTDITVTHTKTPGPLSTRNIEIYESRLAAGVKLSARGTYYYARELREHQRYIDAICYFQKFLNDGGWSEDNIQACILLADCYEKVGEYKKQEEVLLQSFMYALPRAEAACALGYIYKKRTKWQEAIFWFKFAYTAPRPEHCWGFIQEDHWDYIPCIELAYCYSMVGDLELAIQFNNRAGDFKPNDLAVRHNRDYFAAQDKKRQKFVDVLEARRRKEEEENVT